MHTRSLTRLLLVPAVAAAAALGGCGGDSADTPKIADAWARVTAPGQTTGAIYLTVDSDTADTLTAASVPATVAGMAQLHETTMAAGGDTMSGHTTTTMQGMKQVRSIPVAAGKTLKLQPGGYHIMLMQLKAPIAAGAHIPVTLTFTKAGTMTVDAVARR